MKVKINNEPEQEIRFPCLVYVGENILLITGYTGDSKTLFKGVAISHDKMKIGEQSNCFEIREWKPLKGEIILSN